MTIMYKNAIKKSEKLFKGNFSEIEYDKNKIDLIGNSLGCPEHFYQLKNKINYDGLKRKKEYYEGIDSKFKLLTDMKNNYKHTHIHTKSNSLHLLDKSLVPQNETKNEDKISNLSPNISPKNVFAGFINKNQHKPKTLIKNKIQTKFQDLNCPLKLQYSMNPKTTKSFLIESDTSSLLSSETKNF